MEETRKVPVRIECDGPPYTTKISILDGSLHLMVTGYTLSSHVKDDHGRLRGQLHTTDGVAFDIVGLVELPVEPEDIFIVADLSKASVVAVQEQDKIRVQFMKLLPDQQRGNFYVKGGIQGDVAKGKVAKMLGEKFHSLSQGQIQLIAEEVSKLLAD